MQAIERHVFQPEYAISGNLIELSRKELCELVAEICRQVRDEVGNKSYHGGIYPENISRSPTGEIAIGPGKKNEWNTQELQYVAPEIYWNNKSSPQSDVYALGLILYYGASAGKLPFEEDSGNAQLMRMSGKTVFAPAAAGKHLGDIIEKALRFKETERYRNPEELAIMLDYCEDNRILGDRSGAEAIFHKEEEELSDLERMMLSIIEGKAEPDLTEQRKDGEDEVLDDIVASVREESAERLSEDEMFAAAGLSRPAPAPKEDEVKESLAELFGLDEPDPRDPAELEAEEEIRVYEPGSGKKGIPILTEEKDPELAPITVKNKPGRRAAPRTAVKEPERTPEQKKRPLLVVLMLLSVLLIAAVVAKILIDAFSGTGRGNDQPNVSVVMATPDPNSEQMTVEGSQAENSTDISAILSEEQLQNQQEEEPAAATAELQPSVDPATLPHSYEAVRADVSWTQARDEAIAHGGYLVTINSEEEFQQVVALAEEAGFDRIWIGAHRVDGELVWESGENVSFFRWDDGEPSYTDSGDGAAEDYLMLWMRSGHWVYNDSRENPLTDFYGMYGGRIGYVTEKVG